MESLPYFLLCPCTRPGCTGNPIILMTISIICRSGTKKTKESETNTIDRAIANLMFNKLDFPVQDLSLTASSSSDNKIMGSMEPLDCKPYKSQVHHSNSHLAQPKDAEVPVLGRQQDQYTMVNMETGFSIKVAENNKSSVLDFGSIAG